METWKKVSIAAATILVVSLLRAEEGISANSRVELALADYAKLLCSAEFISHRSLEEAEQHSGPLVTENIGSSYSVLSESDRVSNTRVVVDRKSRLVRVSLRNLGPRTAKFYGDQGCVILPRGAQNVFFIPEQVRTQLPRASRQPWPMGDVLPNDSIPVEINRAKLNAAVDLAFSDAEAQTAAFLIIYDGQIVAERYGLGVDRNTLLDGASMGKSLLAALVGILIKDGQLGLYDPVPVPEWQRPDDLRSQIRIADLLRMSGGLHFSAPRDPDFSPEVYPDHDYVYNGAINIYEFAYARPLQFPPNTEGRYRNCDPLTLGYIVQQTVKKRGEDYLSYPQRALLDRIGIRKMVLETDPFGNMFFTGNTYGTARDWARLGLLYLRDGVWLGRRILPEGFVDFIRTPAPAWKEPVYGGLFWLNGTGHWNLPKDAYYMSGEGGKVFVVPSLKLVVVRMGFEGGQERGMKILNLALSELSAAFQSAKPE